MTNMSQSNTEKNIPFDLHKEKTGLSLKKKLDLMISNKRQTVVYHAYKVWVQHLQQQLDKHWLILFHQLITLVTQKHEV